MIFWRPCGECAALVPAETGCKHWTPGKMGGAAAASKARRRRLKEQAAERRTEAESRKAELAAFQAMMTR